MSGSLDHTTPVPLYFQLQTELARQVEAGELQPGDQLPGEAELGERYGVSRTVVRAALQELAHRDLIIKRRGVGSFVAYPKISERLFQGIGGVHDEMVDQGLDLRTEILEYGVVPADGHIAEHLALTPGDPVHRLVRRRFVEDEPLLLGTTHLPVELVPDLDVDQLENGSLYRFLRDHHGVELASGRRVFGSVAAGEDEAAHLDVAVGAPLSLIRSVGLTADGLPVEYFESLHRGDRAVFEVTVLTGGQMPPDGLPDLDPPGAVNWRHLSADLTV